jgi:tetratricopeptide (TPR) repeat protein
MWLDEDECRMNAGAERVQSRPTKPRSLPERIIFFVGVSALLASLIAGFVQGYEMSDGLPFGSMAYIRVAKRYVAAGDLDAAAAEYLALQRLDQMSIMGSMKLADTLEKQGQSEGALEALRVGTTRSFDPAIHIRYSHALTRAERYAEAEDALLRAAALDPDSPLVHLEVGNFYTMRGRFEKAAASYERALTLDPSLIMARHFLTEARKRIDAGVSPTQPEDDGAGQ